MLFRNFHTLDGVSGSAVYLNQTDLVRKCLHPSPAHSWQSQILGFWFWLLRPALFGLPQTLGATSATRTLQVHIDNETIFVNNTAGVEDARCPHTDGEKSEYCADGCTPVFGGGALYIGMATAGIW
jgi:hypothetical protein